MAGATSSKVHVTPLRNDERLRILENATEKMRSQGALDTALDLRALASQTSNYNRSELELLVCLAQGNALSAQLLKNEGVPTTEGLKLTTGDFESAMDDVTPATQSCP